MSTWYDELRAYVDRWDRLDWLALAITRAGLAGLLPWWRVNDMLDHLEQVRWLEDRTGLYVVPSPEALPAARSRPVVDLSCWKTQRRPCPPSCEFCGAGS